MTSKLDPQELERLSKAAEQEDDDVRYYGGPTSTHRPARDAYHAALVQLHRTGQLVPAMPSDPWAGQAELLDECQKAASELDRQALTNIRTLTDAQPSGDVVEAVARALFKLALSRMPDEPPQGLAPIWQDWIDDAAAAITTYEAVSGVAKMRDALRDLIEAIDAPRYGDDSIWDDLHGLGHGPGPLERARAALGEKP